MIIIKFYKLKEVCSKIGSGATPKGGKSAYLSKGISLIRSQNVLDFTFSEDGLAFINDAQAKALSNVEVQERDVLVNITGDSVARVCQVPNEYLPARVNQHVAILRADNSKLSPEFLKYSLLTKYNKDRLLSLASTGATRNALTKSMLEDFEISAPEDVAVQNCIAEILSALDDKIELNRRMNQTLEQMAQTLFRQYFVDGIDEENLPDGWSIKSLSDLVDITSSKRIFLNEYVTEGIPFYRGKEIIQLHRTGIISTELFITEEKFNSIKAKFGAPKEGDILLTSVGTIGVPYLVNKDDDFYFKDGNITWVKSYLDYIGPFYLYQWLISEKGQSSIDNITIGSTQKAVTIQSLKTMQVVIPPKELHDTICNQLEALRAKVSHNIREIKTLIETRDYLLPKLMSGEIDVMQTQPEALHEPVLS